MAVAAEHQDAGSPEVSKSWWTRNWGAVLRQVVINLFNLIILLPLAWVLMMSVKTLPDALRGDFWPCSFDFTHYSYVLSASTRCR